VADRVNPSSFQVERWKPGYVVQCGGIYWTCGMNLWCPPSRDTSCLCCEHKQGQRGATLFSLKWTENSLFPFFFFCELAKSPCKTRNDMLNQLVACCCRLQTFISRLFRFFTSPLGNDEHIFLALIFVPCSSCDRQSPGRSYSISGICHICRREGKIPKYCKTRGTVKSEHLRLRIQHFNPNLRISWQFFSPSGASVRWRAMESTYRGFAITLRHTALRWTLLDKRLAQCRDFYLITRKI
jgi:hypothetical protein